MELSTQKHISNDPDDQGLPSRQIVQVKLFEGLTEALQIEPIVDYNTLPRFDYSNENKFNPFGYDLRKGEKLTTKKTFYRKNCLRHKIVRIHKEFRFVKSHIQFYRQLTPREKQIVQLLARGNNNTEIAKRLFISRRTVEQHHKHINHKLKLRSLSFLVEYAYAFNLI